MSAVAAQAATARPRVDGLVWIAAAALALGLVWWAEHVQGMAPCALCLLERWPYRALLLLGLARVVPMRAAFARAVFWLAILALLAAAGLALVHVGVERHWWPDPIPSCAAPTFHGGSLRERLASMPLRPAKPCDAANRLFDWLPLSMTTLDLLYALGLLAVLPLLPHRLGRRPG